MCHAGKVRAGLIKGRNSYPWIAPLLIRTSVREKAGCETIAMDAHARLYYDPDLVDSLTVDEVAYHIKKSALAVILRHGKRAVNFVTDKNSEQCWEKASNIVVNGLLEYDNQSVPESAATACNVTDSNGKTLPRQLSIEEYYRLILTDEEEQEDGDDDGKQSVDLPGCSGQNGSQQDYEDEFSDPEIGGDADGMTDGEIDKIRDGMVEQRGGDSMSRSGNSALANMVDETASHKVSPQTLLKMAVSKNINQRKRGFDYRTYKRTSRRESIGGFLRPTWESPVPSVCVIVDVSQSMTDEDIELAFGMIDTAFKGMKLRQLRVVGANTSVNSDQIVSSLSGVKLKRGGGTAMDDAVHKVMDVPTKDLPDLVILVTDGGTQWPDRDKTKTPFISCVTRAESEDPLWRPCPDWMKLVYMID